MEEKYKLNKNVCIINNKNGRNSDSMRTKRQRQNIFSIKLLVALGDLFWVNLVFVLMFMSQNSEMGFFSFDFIHAEGFKYIFVTMNMAYLTSLFYCGVILDQRIVFIEKILELVTRTIALFSALFLAACFITEPVLPVPYLVLFFCTSFVAVAIWRITFRTLLSAYRERGGNTRNVIVLGAGRVANKVYTTNLTNVMNGYKFLGFFDDRNPEDYRVEPSLVKGTLSDVEEFITENHVDEIICALPAGDDRKAVPIMKFAENNMIRFFIVPDFMRFVTRSVSLGFLEQSIPVVSLREEPLLKGYNRLFKRCFDIFVSLLFTITVFPFLYIVLGTIIKCTSKGPVFFKQKRTGENGSEFYCLKFRTMEVNKDADKVQATKGDARITKIGKFMRKTNLDEMPQFLNVLMGDMSVVGPRPHMLRHTEMYSKLIDKYMVRHYAKPGITGWAQVTGYRGETKELSEMEGRIRQDVWYIENWTFWLDIRIIFKTVVNMIHGEEKAY